MKLCCGIDVRASFNFVILVESFLKKSNDSNIKSSRDLFLVSRRLVLSRGGGDSTNERGGDARRLA